MKKWIHIIKEKKENIQWLSGCKDGRLLKDALKNFALKYFKKPKRSWLDMT